LPENLPFRVISRTIGTGAYALYDEYHVTSTIKPLQANSKLYSIRKACPRNAPKPIIAVKFIHKDHAYKLGRVKPKQIAAEVALHAHVGKHQNIIQFLSTGEDPVWTWIAMELAEGDLFDKIEADEGVGEDVAHFYFSQLVSAVGYMHSRNVAHRDIKPENILLADGDLKLADFGLAVLFGFNGQKKLCQTVCGSPPYMAPEVVPKDGFTGQKTAPYEGNTADIWSCGIVLFVLLVGNTPWDEPTRNSFEFSEYVQNGATPNGMIDELWTKIPSQATSLLRGMLRVDPAHRFSLEDVRRHPWFAQISPHMGADGRAIDPIKLATSMFERLHVDFTADPTASQYQRPHNTTSPDAMDIDDHPGRLALTQPDAPIAEATLDWETPSRLRVAEGISASQPVGGAHNHDMLADRFMGDPVLSQFSATPRVPLSVTQAARHFRDIVPSHSLARFLSFMDFPLLLPLICEALGRLGIPVLSLPRRVLEGREGKVSIPLKTRDQRQCVLAGAISVEKLEEEVLEVRFLKAKGDPLEWRRLFKKVAVLCKDGILRFDED